MLWARVGEGWFHLFVNTVFELIIFLASTYTTFVFGILWGVGTSELRLQTSLPYVFCSLSLVITDVVFFFQDSKLHCTLAWITGGALEIMEASPSEMLI